MGRPTARPSVERPDPQYDVAPMAVSVDRQLVRALRRSGASPQEIERAANEGWLTLLAIDRVLLPGARRYNALEVSDRSGIEPELALRLWRTMGFPEPPLNTPMFTDEAAIALEKVVAQSWRRDLGPDVEAPDRVVSSARAVSAGLARVAESLSDEMAAVIRELRTGGVSDQDIALGVVNLISWDELRVVQDYALRSMLRAALWRKIATSPHDHGTEVTVGFLDLVGFTSRSLQVSVTDLASMIDRFEAMAYDLVATHGGRTVKMIGDEVMFVADDPANAAAIALDLLDAIRDDPVLPDGRAALATGIALSRDGDYFGPVVNLASRLAEIARPKTVLADEECSTQLQDDERFVFKKASSRRIRDVGRQRLWVVRRGEPREESMVDDLDEREPESDLDEREPGSIDEAL